MIILWCSGEAKWLLSSGFEPNPSLQIGQWSPFCKEFRLPREVAAWLPSSFGGSVAVFMSLLVFWAELSGAVVVVVGVELADAAAAIALRFFFPLGLGIDRSSH